MKQTYKKISKALVILATVLLVLVGCSDMMVKIGDIVLKIEAEDTIRTYVETYTVTGSLEGSKSSSLSFEDVKPDQEVLVPNIAPGKWTFTVVAFDVAKKQIGTGTTAITLAEGQKVDLRVPVLFDPLPLGIGEPRFPETLDKIYDGTTTLTVTAGALSGLVDGYEEVRAEARATYADKGAGSAKVVTVSYDLVYDDATITNKYDSLADNTAYTGDIHQRQLTISAPIFPTTKNKEYDGTNTLAVTAGDFTNLVEGDDVTVTAHAGYSDKNVEENKVITITYTIGGSDAANYITPVTDTSYSGSIAKKPLTFTVAAKDRKYNGDTTAEGAITLEGMVPSDAKAVGATGTFAFSDKNVGSEKTVSVTAITLTGDEKDNYSLTESEATTTATISKKTFDMSGIGFEDVSRIYNNEAFELAISGTLPEGVSVSYSGNTGNIHVGTYEVTASFSVDEANHEAIDAMVATLTIEKKVLTREGTYLKLSKPYDKNRTALFTLDQEKSGKVRGDKINVSIEAYYSNASVGPNSITVTYALTGDNIRNYTRPENYIEPAGVILPIQLTVESPSLEVTSKTYDGTTALGTTSVTPTGVLPGDAVALTATATYRDRNVGTAKAILVTYALDAPNTNYLAPKASTVYEGVITKKVLFVKPNSTQIAPSKIYDGTLSAKVLDAGTPIGVASDDNVVLGATASYQDKNVLLEGDTPQPKPVTVLYSLSGLHADNYTLEEPTNSTDYSATITRKALGVYANTTQVDTGKFYDGTRKALVRSKGILDGLVSGDDVTLSTEALYASADAGANNQITVSYTLDGDDKNNYTKPVDNTRIVGTISKRALSIVAGSTSISTERPYNRGTLALVTHKGTLEGVVGLEDVTLSTSASYEDADAGENKKITVSYALLGTAVANYLAPASYTIFTGTITPLQLGIGEPSLSAPSKIYDGSDSVSGTITQGALTGLLDGDRGTVTLQATATYLNKDVGGDKAVTVHYTLDESSTNAVNYIAPGDSILKTGSIDAKQLTISKPEFSHTSKSYDGNTTLSVSPGSLGGVVTGDRITADAFGTYDTNEIGDEKVITVTYTIKGFNVGNYLSPETDTSYRGSITKSKLSISNPTLTKTKIYNDSRECAVTPGKIQTGVIGMEDVKVLATALYDNEKAGSNKTITVTYHLEGNNMDNYIAPDDYSTKEGKIEKKQITISNPSISNTSKVYDGTDTFESFTIGDVTGLYDDSGVTVTASGKYLDGRVGTNKYITVTYALSGTDANIGNYVVPAPYTAKTGVITKKALKVGSGATETTVVSQSKEYDGELSAEVTRHGKPQGLVHNEDVVLTATASYNSKTVIAGKTITVGYSLSGTHATNYTAPDGYTIEAAEITKKQLTVKSGTTKVVTEKLSDEKVDVEVLYPGDLAGIVGNDDVTLGALATYRDAAVGKNKTITVVYSLGGDDAGNYIAPSTTSAFTGDITNLQLTIAPPELIKTRIYNSTDECIVIPSKNVWGIVGTDEVKIGAVATFDNKNAGTDKEITVVYSLSGRDADKYDAPANFVTGDGVIQPKQLSISAPTVSNLSKQYDGKASVDFTPGTVSGKYDTDSVEVVVIGKYLSPAIENHKQLLFSYTLEGDDAKNYLRPEYDVIIDASITKRVLSVEASSTKVDTDKIYDTNTVARVSTIGNLRDVVTGVEGVSLSATASYVEATAGSRDIVVTYTLSGADADYYEAPASMTIPGRITPKPLGITGTPIAASKGYDGKTQTTGTISLEGIIGLDDVSAIGRFEFVNADAGDDKSVLITEIELTGNQAENYSLATKTATAQAAIQKKQLGFTVSVYDKEYDGDYKAQGSISLLGKVDLDDVSATGIFTFSDLNASDSSQRVNITTIELTGDQRDNYSLATTTATAQAKIKKATYDMDGIKFVGTSIAYDGEEHSLAVDGTLPSGVLVDYSNNGKTAANTYEVIASFRGDAVNYHAISDKSATLTIEPKLLRVAATVDNKPYDGNDVAVGRLALIGIVGSDDVSATGIFTFADAKAHDSFKRVDVSGITLSGDQRQNYTVPVTTKAQAKIDKKLLTVAASAEDKVYNSDIETVGILTLAGKVDLDEVTASGTFAFDNKNVGLGKTVSITDITLGGYDSENYSVSPTATAQANISKKPLRFTVTAHNRAYNGNNTASGIIDLIGVMASDVTNVGAMGTFTFSDGIVGTDKSVSVINIELTGIEKGNYSLAETTATTTATIIKKIFDMTGITFEDASPIYDTKAHPLAIGGTLPDGVTVSYSSNNNSIQAGTYEVTAFFSVDEVNHDIISEKTATLEIQKKILTTDGTYLTLSKPYDKNLTAQVSIDQIRSGKVRGDSIVLSVEAYYADDSVSVREDKAITVYYTLTGENTHNYSKPAAYTVNTGAIKPIQLTISNPSFATSKTYDGTLTLPVTKGTLSGVLSGDTVSVTATASFRDKNVGTNKAITVSYTLDDPNANYLVPVSSTIYTGKIKPLLLVEDIAISPVTSKIYDGKDSALFNGGTLRGVLAGDSVTVTPSAKYMDRHVGATKIITTSYTLSGPDSDNYSAPSSSETRGIIEPMKLEINTPTFANNGSKTYDGTEIAIVNVGSLTNDVEGDWVFVNAEATYDTKHAADNKKITVTYSLYGPNASNYLTPDSSEMERVGTIRKKQLYIEDPTIPNTSKAYDGNTSIEYTLGDLIGICENNGVKDSVSIDTTRSKGFYNSKTIESDKNMFFTYELTGSDAGNYISPRMNLIRNGEITRRALTLVGTTVTPKTYDGTTTATIGVRGSLQGMLVGEHVEIDTISALYSTKSVNDTNPITIKYTLKGPDASKYVPTDKIVSGSITKKALEATGTLIHPTKTYDGTKNATVSTLGTLVSGGVVSPDSVTLQATAEYASKNVYEAHQNITVTYTLSGSDAGNYTAPAAYTLHTGVINKKVITVSGTTIDNKVYDGNRTANVRSLGTLQSVVYPDVVTLQSATALYATSTAGANKPVTIAYTLGGKDKENYTVQNGSKTATINKALLSISEVKASDKTYNGTVNTAGSIKLSGKIGSDSVIASGEFTFVDAKASTNSKTVNVKITLTGAQAENYSVASTTTTTAIISPKALEATGTLIHPTKTYDGTKNATISTIGTLVSGGVVSPDSVTLQATAEYASKNVYEAHQNITVTYALSGSDAGNYTAPDAYTLYTGVINKKLLTVSGTTIENKEYDGNSTANVGSPGTLQSVVYPDVVTLQSATAQYATATAGANKPVTIAYTLGGKDKDNYTVQNGSKTASISKAVIDMSGVKYTDRFVTYNGSEQTLLSQNLPSGTYAEFERKVKAGTHVIAVSFHASDSDNYVVSPTSTTGTMIIYQKRVGLNPTYNNKIYDGTKNAVGSLTVAVKDIVEGDQVTATGTFTFDNADAGSNKQISISNILLGGTDSPNYKLDGAVYSGYNFSIDKKTLNFLSVEATDKTYDGGLNTTGTITLSGKIGDDDVGAKGTFTFADANASENPKTVNVKDITLTGAQSHNYSVASTTTTRAKINPVIMTGNVSINGDPTEGNVLTAYSTNLTNAGTPTYQWKRGGSAISGATGLQYTLVSLDVGKQITFTVTAGVPNYSGSITSNPVTVKPKPLKIGDSYGGGKVAYLGEIKINGITVAPNGLIAAVSDQSAGIVWAINNDFYTTGVNNSSLGSGLSNTNTLISKLGYGYSYAARLARSYQGGGYEDWFLPSLEELKILRTNKVAIGNFDSTGTYWSSTEQIGDLSSTEGLAVNSTNSVQVVPFNQSYQTWAEFKDGIHPGHAFQIRVRAVRYF